MLVQGGDLGRREVLLLSEAGQHSDGRRRDDFLLTGEVRILLLHPVGEGGDEGIRSSDLRRDLLLDGLKAVEEGLRSGIVTVDMLEIGFSFIPP